MTNKVLEEAELERQMRVRAVELLVEEGRNPSGHERKNSNQESDIREIAASLAN